MEDMDILTPNVQHMYDKVKSLRRINEIKDIYQMGSKIGQGTSGHVR